MALALSDLRQQTHDAWLQLSRTQSIVLILIVGTLVASLALVAVWARTPSYRVAYSRVTEEDAAAIVQDLQERQIPYRLEAGGTRILVPDNQVEDVRLQVATGRLPSSGSGFELFDKAQFGATDYAQRINYQRALEGELARTIARLSPVEQARVHLVVPTPSLYLDQEKPATASVMVKLRPGQRLTEGQIRGIAYLVAGSVSGLKPEHLSIVDTSGNVLSSSLNKSAANGGVASGDQRSTQREFEIGLERDILAMLELMTGPGKASVRVSAAMNWDLQETSSETYLPTGDRPVVRSAKELSEGYDRADPGAGGTPGTATNLPTYQQPASTDQSGQGAYSRRESTTNYEVSKTVAKVVKTPGSVVRLSIAVALDRNEPVSGEYLDQIRDLVTAAAGLDTARGDTLSVTAVPFLVKDPEPDQQALEAMRQEDLIRDGIRTAGLAIGPAVLLVVLYLLLRRFRSLPLTTGYGPPTVYSGPAPMGAVSGPDSPQSLAPGMQPRTFVARSPQQAEALQELTAMAKTQPHLLAQTITTWLEEDQRRQ